MAAAAILPLHAGGDDSSIPLRAGQRVIAIGDVHGDYEAFTSILSQAGLLDNMRRWTGRNAILVQTGDFFDRGPRVREVMDLMMNLERQAQADGGRVIVLLGNHETMNLLGETRDVSADTYADFAGSGSEQRREEAWKAYEKTMATRKQVAAVVAPGYAPQTREEWLATRPPGFFEYREALARDGRYGRWLREKMAAVRVGDTVFLHGGIAPELAPKSLDELNERVRGEIDTYDRAMRIMTSRRLVQPFFTLQETLEAARMEMAAIAAVAEGQAVQPTFQSSHDQQTLDRLARIGTWSIINPNGPLWFRGFATWTSDQGHQHLPALLAKYEASRFAVGHTVMGSRRITARFNGQVFLIDTGMLSSHYKGRASALEVRDGRTVAIYMDGRFEIRKEDESR
jgi:hypothetical protein